MQQISYQAGPVKCMEVIGTAQELEDYDVESKYAVEIQGRSDTYTFISDSENEIMTHIQWK